MTLKTLLSAFDHSADLPAGMVVDTSPANGGTFAVQAVADFFPSTDGSTHGNYDTRPYGDYAGVFTVGPGDTPTLTWDFDLTESAVLQFQIAALTNAKVANVTLDGGSWYATADATNAWQCVVISMQAGHHTIVWKPQATGSLTGQVGISLALIYGVDPDVTPAVYDFEDGNYPPQLQASTESADSSVSLYPYFFLEGPWGTDPTNGGSYCLFMFAPDAAGFAQTLTTSTWAADGSIEFDLAVGGGPGAFFTVTIDGTEVLRATGHQDWGHRSVAVTAGTHVVQLRFDAGSTKPTSMYDDPATGTDLPAALIDNLVMGGNDAPGGAGTTPGGGDTGGGGTTGGYGRGDLVRHLGATYLALIDDPAGPPTDGSDWILLGLASAAGGGATPPTATYGTPTAYAFAIDQGSGKADRSRVVITLPAFTDPGSGPNATGYALVLRTDSEGDQVFRSAGMTELAAPGDGSRQIVLDDQPASGQLAHFNFVLVTYAGAYAQTGDGVDVTLAAVSNRAPDPTVLRAVTPPCYSTQGWKQSADRPWGDLTADGDTAVLTLTSNQPEQFVRYYNDTYTVPGPLSLAPLVMQVDMMIPSNTPTGGMSAGVTMSDAGEDGRFNFRVDVNDDGSVGYRFEQDGQAVIESVARSDDFQLDAWHTVQFIRLGASAAATIDGTLVLGTDSGPTSLAHNPTVLLFGAHQAGAVVQFRNMVVLTRAGADLGYSFF